MFMHQGTGRLTAAATLALALAGAGVGSAVAAPGDAASAPEGASVSYAAGSQYTVRPGQSLNDVAIAVTQSHDRGTLARASRALFDANPNAFMSHDPSRMRIGALLTMPALDASGALVASAPVAGAATAASSAATATATATATPASAPNAAAVGAAVGVASGVAQVNAAAASAASAAARAAAPATPAVSGTASSTADASPATAGAVSTAPVAGSQAAGALPVSGAHVWSGAIQPSASEPAEAAPAPATTSVPAAATAQPASQPRAQVSSLQQLLALKNRVLMELQKHGIGGAPAATVTPSTRGAQPAAGGSSAAAVSGHGGAAISTSNDIDISQTNLSVAAAIGAALVVLLAALRLRRRRRDGAAAARGSLAEDAAAASARAAGTQQDGVSTPEPVPASEASNVGDDAAAGHAAALAAADREAEERDAAAREMAARVAAERDAEIRDAAAREATAREAAENKGAETAATERARADQAAAAERAAAERAATEQAAEHEAAALQSFTGLPAQDPNASQHAWQESHPAPASIEPEQPSPDVVPTAQSGFTPEPLPAAHHENLDGATTAASLAAAAELGAEALPLTPLEPVGESFQQEVPPHRLQWDDEPVSSAPAAPLAEPMNEAMNEPFAEPQNHFDTPPPLIDFAQQQVEPSVPTGFPRDAVDAFSSLDMALPPRIESTDAAVNAPESLAAQPVASPETTARQAVTPHDPDDTPHVADEIAAGTAGHAAVAGLGAAGFGALKLDFDLELPPSPAQPLPAFTQADLTRIARNKLDLAAEYIDLGDLSGARTLINEVIEANDPATRADARALLSTLAPLS
ncbi:fimbrial protein FimV [Paraburkholderia sediminicola]